MNDSESPIDQLAPTRRSALRGALLFGLGVTCGAAAVRLATRPPQKTSDDYYAYHVSIGQAEKWAMTCYYKKPDRLSDLKGAGSDESSFRDVWGQPYRYARVPAAGGGEDIYVWTDWTENDGRAFVAGAKVTADGTTVRLGFPLKR